MAELSDAIGEERTRPPLLGGKFEE